MNSWKTIEEISITSFYNFFKEKLKSSNAFKSKPNVIYIYEKIPFINKRHNF